MKKVSKQNHQQLSDFGIKFWDALSTHRTSTFSSLIASKLPPWVSQSTTQWEGSQQPLGLRIQDDREKDDVVENTLEILGSEFGGGKCM